MRTVRINFQELVKERAIVDDCLTHFFGVGFSPLSSQSQCASGAVILDNHGMVNGHVVRTTIEVLERIATRSHHLGDELIGFAHRAVGIVDEARLDAAPCAEKRIGLILSERVQVETADARRALPQHGVRTCRPHSLNGSFVLGPETCAQAHAPMPDHVGPHRKPEQQDSDGYTDEHEGL